NPQCGPKRATMTSTALDVRPGASEAAGRAHATTSTRGVSLVTARSGADEKRVPLLAIRPGVHEGHPRAPASPADYSVRGACDICRHPLRVGLLRRLPARAVVAREAISRVCLVGDVGRTRLRRDRRLPVALVRRAAAEHIYAKMHEPYHLHGFAA